MLGFSLTRSVVVATLFFLLTGASFQLLITLGNAIVQDAVPSRLLASHSYPSSGSSRPALSQSCM